MTLNFWYSILLLVIISGVLYVIINILLQRKAEKRLELLIKKHQKELLSKFDSKDAHNLNDKVHLEGSGFEKRMLLLLMREQIEQLHGSDKLIMKKAFDRKDQDNQSRYAFKLLSDSGFFKLFSKSHSKTLLESLE